MSRNYVVLAILLVLLVAAWFLWHALAGEESELTPRGGHEAGSTGAPPSVAPGDPVARSAPASSRTDPVAAPTKRPANPAPSGVAAAAANETESSAHRHGPRLVVVNGRDGSPIPGAAVDLVRRASVPRPWRSFWSYGLLSFEEVARRFGTRRTADEDGAVLLPPFIDHLVVSCRYGELWTREEVSLERPPMDGVWRLVLHPVRRLEVWVTDEVGRPRGGLLVRLDVDNDGDRVTTDGREIRMRTDAGGRAVLLLREAVRAHARRGNRISVALEAPGVRIERREVKLDPWPHEPVHFVLPPTGVVKVTVQGTNGPPRVPCIVSLNAEAGGVCRALAQDGVAVFSHVGLGRFLSVWIRAPRGKDANIRAKGPTRAGEVVSLTGRVDDRAHWFTGGAVGPGVKGGPGGVRMRLQWVVKPGGTMFRIFGELDAAGRFRVRRSSFMNRYPSVKMRLQTLDWRGLRGQSGWKDITLGPDADLDLGTFRVEPAPLWVSGRVVDETGAPLPWVEIQVAYADMFRRPLLPTAFRVVRGENSATTRRYHSRSDAVGRFEVRGPLPKGRLRLEFTKRFASASRRFVVEPGTRDLEITLVRHGEISGRVLLPEGLDPGQVRLLARKRGGREALEIGLDSAGRFRSEAIHPGVHDLGIYLLGATEPVLSVPDVNVAGGARTADPRLREIDLRGRVARVTLSVRDPDAGVPAGASIMLRAGRKRWRERPADANARVQVWTGPQGLDVEARAPGFRPLRVRGVNADRTLTLQRGIAVRLRYAGTEALPPRAAVLLRVMLEEEAPGHEYGARWPTRRTHLVSHPDATVRSEVSVPGRYSVEVSLRDRRRGNTAEALAATTPHVIVAEVEIVVRDGSGPQTFAIRVDRRAMLEGIEEFNEAISDE